jgi:hypothetical protein
MTTNGLEKRIPELVRLVDRQLELLANTTNSPAAALVEMREARQAGLDQVDQYLERLGDPDNEVAPRNIANELLPRVRVLMDFARAAEHQALAESVQRRLEVQVQSMRPPKELLDEKSLDDMITRHDEAWERALSTVANVKHSIKSENVALVKQVLNRLRLVRWFARSIFVASIIGVIIGALTGTLSDAGAIVVLVALAVAQEFGRARLRLYENTKLRAQLLWMIMVVWQAETIEKSNRIARRYPNVSLAGEP